MNNIKQHFEQNMLDGDEVQSAGQMLSSEYVLEYIEENYVLKPTHQAEAKPQNPYICCVCHSTSEQHCDDCKDLCTMAKPNKSATFKTPVDSKGAVQIVPTLSVYGELHRIMVKLHTAVELAASDILDGDDTGPKKWRDAFEKAELSICAHLQAAVREAETNAVAWAIGTIDLLHEAAPTSEDRTFKGVKNMVRDAYKAQTGIDPAPHYPVTAKLQQLKQEGSNGDQ